MVNEAILDMLRANVRLPQMSIGDLNAGIAARRIAEQQLREIIARYGLVTVVATLEMILDHGEALARKALAAIPPGLYRMEATSHATPPEPTTASQSTRRRYQSTRRKRGGFALAESAEVLAHVVNAA